MSETDKTLNVLVVEGDFDVMPHWFSKHGGNVSVEFIGPRHAGPEVMYPGDVLKAVNIAQQSGKPFDAVVLDGLGFNRSQKYATLLREEAKYDGIILAQQQRPQENAKLQEICDGTYQYAKEAVNTVRNVLTQRSSPTSPSL